MNKRLKAALSFLRANSVDKWLDLMRWKLWGLIGTDSFRDRYASFRRQVHSSTLKTRRQVAEQMARNADFHIPKEDGFIVLAPGHYPQVAEIVRCIRAKLAGVDVAELPAQQKRFFRGGLVSPDDIDVNSPFLQLGLHPGIVAAVSEYLGFVPVLASAEVLCSYASNEAYTKSQLFHCDFDDVTQLKLFVYCCDVGQSNGPLVLVDAQRSKMVRRTLHYRFGGGRYRVRDDEMHRTIGASTEQVITGPEGTVVLADTSRCFHLGSRIDEPGKVRVVFLLQYISPAAFMFPLDFRSMMPFRRLVIPGMPDLDRLLLGGE